MIIFDLDGTLANCEHRRHFVDSSKLGTKEDYENWIRPFIESKECPKWKPDWKSFYEACDKDEPIHAVIDILNSLEETYLRQDISIWSGRCQSVRDKTLSWLSQYLDIDNIGDVKLRPIGDNTPDDELKEMWLNEAIKDGINIEYVLDSNPKSIEMWRRRGIFVFNCCQHDEEF